MNEPAEDIAPQRIRAQYVPFCSHWLETSCQILLEGIMRTDPWCEHCKKRENRQHNQPKNGLFVLSDYSKETGFSIDRSSLVTKAENR